jgi:hypothetical protein
MDRPWVGEQRKVAQHFERSERTHMNEQELEALVASVTPKRVKQWVLELEPRQPEANRGTVPLFEILEILTAGLPLADAAEKSPVEVRLRRAVIAAVSQIEEMTFVETDG